MSLLIEICRGLITSLSGEKISSQNITTCQGKTFFDFHSRSMFFSALDLTFIDCASTLRDSASESNLRYIFRLYKRDLNLVMFKSNALTINDF